MDSDSIDDYMSQSSFETVQLEEDMFRDNIVYEEIVVNSATATTQPNTLKIIVGDHNNTTNKTNSSTIYRVKKSNPTTIGRNTPKLVSSESIISTVSPTIPAISAQNSIVYVKLVSSITTTNPTPTIITSMPVQRHLQTSKSTDFTKAVVTNNLNKIITVTTTTTTKPENIIETSPINTMETGSKTIVDIVSTNSSMNNIPGKTDDTNFVIDITTSENVEEKLTPELVSSNKVDHQYVEVEDKDEIDTQNTPTPKIRREIIQLQKMMNDSKMLTEFINDGETRVRKVKKSSKVDDTDGDLESITSKSSTRDRSRSCSVSSNRSHIDENNRIRKNKKFKHDDTDTEISSKHRSRSHSMSRHRSRSISKDESTTPSRRNMRSLNAEFSAKHQKFLRVVQHQQDSDVSENSDNESQDKMQNRCAKIPKEVHPPPKPGWDIFCWNCHQDECQIPCSECVRSYHADCLKLKQNPKSKNDVITWQCPECILVITADIEYKKNVKPKYGIDHLCKMLRFALKRFTKINGAKLFRFPICKDLIVNPINFAILDNNISKKKYRTTEAFTSDIKWILHNIIVFNNQNSKLLAVAKNITKICKQEMYDIETCPECYYNANTRKDDWFVEVCSRPHMLLWAKLKGFPYWPAKSMGVNSAALVDVRFFGDHDRAWIPVRDCFLYSKMDPNLPTYKSKRHSIADSIKEVDIYVNKITVKFGSFVYAPYKQPYEPHKEDEQLQMMIPGINTSLKNSHSSPSKSDLTYKIVKTADNNLSIIKKNDCNGASVKIEKLNEEISLDTKKKNNCKIIDKSKKDTTNNIPETISQSRKNSTGEIKTYQVLRRQSLTENCITGKVDSVVLKRKSNNLNDSSTITEPLAIKKARKDCVLYNVNSTLTPSEDTVSSSDDLININPSTSKNVSTRVKVLDKIKIVSKPSNDSELTTKCIVDSIQSKQFDPQVTEPSTTLLNEADEKLDHVNNIAQSNEKPKIDMAVVQTDEIMSKEKDAAEARSNYSKESSPIAISSSTSTVSAQINDKIVEESNLKITSSTPNPLTENRSEESTNRVLLDSTPNTASKPPVVVTTGRLFINQEMRIEESPNKVTDGKTDEPSAQRSFVANNNLKNQEIIAPTSVSVEKTAKIISDITPVVMITPIPLDISNKEANKHTNNKNIIIDNVQENLLIPMQEIKSEVYDECINNNSNKNNEDTTSNKNKVTAWNLTENSSDPLEISIKPEPLSSDESEDLIETVQPVASPATKTHVELIGIRKGGISVKDISKLKGPIVRKTNTPQAAVKATKKTAKVDNSKEPKQRARKSFPTNLSLAPTRPNITNVYQNGKTGSSMVYIPIDGKQYQRIDASMLGQQINDINTSLPKTMALPPPLTSVTLGSLQIKNLSTMSNPMPIVPSSTIFTNSPPPLSLTSINLQPTMQTISSIPLNTSVQHMLTGYVSENLASAVTDAMVRGPPKLFTKPSAPLRSDGNDVFPSEAGPVARLLVDNSHKMADFFRSVIEDTLEDMANVSGCLQAKVKMLELEIEKLKFAHTKELNDLKINTDLILCEMRTSLENEKTRLINETRKQCENERIRAIEETKRKQWCVNCNKEAQFYCCWNTSYCDYPCQQQHWLRHMSSCSQNDINNCETASKTGGVIGKLVQFNSKDKPPPKGKDTTPTLAPRIINTTIRNYASRINKVQRMVPITTNTRGMHPCYTILNRQGSCVMVTPTTNAQHKTIVSNTQNANIIINSLPTNNASSGESIRITPD